MKRLVICFTFAWWFFYPWYGGSTVGPFPNQKICEEIRDSVNKATICWWDGKST